MDMRERVFRSRGFTPVPFLLAAVLWANPTIILIAIGAVLCLFGELMRIDALRHAGGATRTRTVGAHSLVQSGPYAHVRNPLYLANMMLYAGFAIASGSLSPWLPLAIVIYFSWQYGMIISLEEGTLKDLFGPSYAEYCKKVPRLWPTFGTGSGVRNKAPYSIMEALREERSTIMGLVAAWIILALRLQFFPPFH